MHILVSDLAIRPLLCGILNQPNKQMGESKDRLISNGDIQPHEANKSEKPPFVVDQTRNL